MRKKLLIIMILFLLSGCNVRNLSKEETTENNFITTNFTLNLAEIQNCTNQLKEYYTYQDRTVYLVCLDEIYLKRENTKDITLKYHFQNVNQSFDNSIKELVSDINNIDFLDDGGTKIYKTDNYTIIECNTLEGNQDIYIGNQDMKYKSNFCQNDNTTFTRTYTIEKVENYIEQQYENGIPVTYGKSLKVTLSKFQEETQTVIINNLWDELREGATYEFEFMLNKDITNIEDTIESIFKNTTIVEVKTTEKVGLSQRQDAIN